MAKGPDPLGAFPGDASTSAWGTAVVTAVAYGLLLLIMAAVLFGVPYLVFAA